MRTFINGSTPTVLLVHGAFADASSWSDVVADLQGAGIEVIAAANPLRGVAGDAAYLAGIAHRIDGPVLLVGHCYGGAVITEAGGQTDNIVGLVYVAAFAPAEGESLLDLSARFPDTLLGPALRPTANAELSLTVDRYREVFAADLPERLTSVAAAAQRPVATAAFEQRCTAAAWRRLPSWFIVATTDQAVHPEAQRFMARRIGADTVEFEASHAIIRSRPAEVAAQIRIATHTAQADPNREARS